MKSKRKHLDRELLDGVVVRDTARVRELLRRGADVNSMGREHHETALILAVKFADAEMVRLLLGAGAAVNARDDCGRTALFYAPVTSEMFDALLGAGADIHARDEEGNTILTWKVSQSAALAEVEELLRLGVDRGARTVDGETALDMAQSLGLLKVVERLRARTLALVALLFIFVGGECAKNQARAAAGASAGLPRQAATLKPSVIVFNSNRTGNDEIYVMNADGSGVRALTSDERYDSWWPRISPDRRRILFYRSPKGVHDDDYAKQSLWVMNADGSSARQLRAAGMDGWKIQGHAEWSPDGNRLVMFGGKEWKSSHVYITDVEGRNPRRLTSRKDAHYVDPSWSPDGRTIVFAGCPPQRCGPQDLEVFTLPVSGAQPERQLTNDAVPDYDPYYSPDGKWVGWTSMVSGAGAHGVWNIRLAAADGSGVRFVTNDGNVNGYPAWSKDGKLIYFHRMVYGGNPNFGIYVIRPDGQGMKAVAGGEDGNDEYPST